MSDIKQWEYAQLDVTIAKSSKGQGLVVQHVNFVEFRTDQRTQSPSYQAALNVLGLEGWEMCSNRTVPPGFSIFIESYSFKRPIVVISEV